MTNTTRPRRPIVSIVYRAPNTGAARRAMRAIGAWWDKHGGVWCVPFEAEAKANAIPGARYAKR